MLSQPPEHADPRRLCEQGKRYEGRVALLGLPRLAPLLTSTEGEAAFTLRFDQDDEGRSRIIGHVRADLQVTCQRCMGAMTLPVDAEFKLSPVSGPREAETLPAEYDPLLLELILAIPPAPRHPEAECGVNLAVFRHEEDSAPIAEAERDNPFAALQALKRGPGKENPE